MKTPIEPKDIKAGDLIRWESPDGDEAHESRITNPRATGFTAGKHYLLDRPQPAVDLPTEPTLGWLTTYEGEESSGLGIHRTRLGIYEPYDDGVTDNAAAGMWPGSSIISFVEATAVPTSALDKLRKVHLSREGCGELKCGSFKDADKFLAAVDEAAL